MAPRSFARLWIWPLAPGMCRLSSATESLFPSCQWVPFWLGQDSTAATARPLSSMETLQFDSSWYFHLCLAWGATQPASPRRGADGWHTSCSQIAPGGRSGPFLPFWGGSGWHGPGCAPTTGSDVQGAGESIVSTPEIQRPLLRLHTQHCPDIK